ncbi:Na(+)-translocating NADH-quinone reductase subunit A, partial [Elusimicrobiota bacterium]
VPARRRGDPGSGRPEPVIADAPPPSHVAIQPPDFRYLRPRLKVKEGQKVKLGTPLFESKDDPRVVFVALGGGKVSEVRRGKRRRILDVVVELDKDEEVEDFGALKPEEARKLGRKDVIDRLLKGGLWPLLNQRPFSCVPNPDDEPKAFFVGGTAREPWCPDPDVVLEGKEEDFQLGLDILKKLTAGKTYLCVSADAKCKALTEARGVELRRFTGPHPAGNIAVQVYHIDPPDGKETVWYIKSQDVLTVARFFKTGRLPVERIVSVCGPSVKEAERRYYRTRLGASVESLTKGKLVEGDLRHISGGVLTGRQVPADGFLGLRETTMYVLPEGRNRELLSFVRPGFEKYSLSRSVVSSFIPGGSHVLDTNCCGGLRNFVMTGIYEDVCAVDIIPEQLAKSVIAGDLEEAEKHGILDCAECGLCTFICPSDIEIADVIERGLAQIRKGV